VNIGFVGFLFGATGMFATMYATQAILPRLGRDFHVSDSTAGLSISVLVVCVGAGAWLWGPLSDRIGRRRSLLLASTVLPFPVILSAAAPTFPLLLVARGLQGLCMPGLLIVSLPYVMEAFGRTMGRRAMGYYVFSLTFGGLVGRVGVAELSAVVGWRVALGSLAVLPAVASIVMRRTLPPEPDAGTLRGDERFLHSARRVLRSRALIGSMLVGFGCFFTFTGVFSYVTFRLEAPPFSFSDSKTGLIFTLWALGFFGPVAGRVAERVGWRVICLTAMVFVLVGVVITIPARVPTLILGLAFLSVGMYAGTTGAQLGVSSSTRHDRGIASAFYFTAFYTAATLAGYVPGLVWESHGWGGVVVLALCVITTFGIAAAWTLHGVPDTQPRPEEVPLGEAP